MVAEHTASMKLATPCELLARPLLFTSPKCRVAIPVDDVLLRYALQQASLDSSVREISYRSGPQLECPAISLAGVVLRSDSGTFLLSVHETRLDRSEEEIARLAYVFDRYGLRLLERDARDIRREPVFSNARAIWSHAGRDVSLTDRLRIGVALEYGPLSIFELEHLAQPSCDIVDAVCALACEDLLRLNIQDAPLSARTFVLGS